MQNRLLPFSCSACEVRGCISHLSHHRGVRTPHQSIPPAPRERETTQRQEKTEAKGEHLSSPGSLDSQTHPQGFRLPLPSKRKALPGAGVLHPAAVSLPGNHCPASALQSTTRLARLKLIRHRYIFLLASDPKPFRLPTGNHRSCLRAVHWLRSGLSSFFHFFFPVGARLFPAPG